MARAKNAEEYYASAESYGEELRLLRELALKSGAKETLKWGSPVYTIEGKNVFGIMGFKNHFGIWFFNGVFLKDPDGVLEAAQETTKALRHWKFFNRDQIEPKRILAYMDEAIANQKKGVELKPEKKKAITIPPLLKKALDSDQQLMSSFRNLTPYKQREYCEYIGSAKMEKTRISRLESCLPLIREGIALNDKYR